MPDVAIAGVGLFPFGRHAGVTGLSMAASATREALADAALDWADVDIAFGGSYAAGKADGLADQLGLTGIPFVNVFNGCATGASALAMAAGAVRSGEAECALAVGFDQHPPGAFDPLPADWGLGPWYGELGFMLPTQFMAMKAVRYMHDFGISPGTFAKVAAKAFANGARTPTAWRRKEWTEEQVAASPMLNDPLTQHMFCSPCDGAAAVIVTRDGHHTATGPAVYLRSVAARTRRFGSFEVWRPWIALDDAESPSGEAARVALARAGLNPTDVDVFQLQDTSSSTEVSAMAECGLCKDGEQEALIRSDATTFTGMLPINTDGGCLANGEPIGASGLRQVRECVLQLRGTAGDRQIPNPPEVALTHVYGAPGLSACCVLSR